MTRPLLGDCSEMVKLRELISQVASTDATVLILGESGTGKELVARSLHEQSSRNKSPFVPVNMAALPKELAESTLFGHEKGAFTGADQRQIGCCEAADKGTLFLDEIGEMELGLQSKLLRFLQERTLQRVGSQTSINVDVRVLAATNRDLAQRVEDGEFRQDLYYRLHVVPVHVPPLSERKEDIPLLAARFLDKAASRYQKDVVGFSKEAIQQLKGYAWPGNVRQLENMVERLVILNQGSTIEADALPEEIQQQSHSNNENTQPTDDNSELRPIEEIEKQAILDALKRAEGNVRAAAKLLGLGHATVYRKIKAYQIDLKK
ncbi:MAG: sigma-54 interaction domain-containing protein [Gemmataceae bacterium]